MASNMSLQWVRPSNIPYPTVWHTFDAQESRSSNKLVKYIIQDVPENRFEDVIQHMIDYFLVDHSLTDTITGVSYDEYVEDLKRAWRAVLKQKCSVVCLRADSDEIIGINIHSVETKNDTFEHEMSESCKSKGFSDIKNTAKIMCANFCPYEKYNVNQFLGSYGLSVHPMYRGCGIAQRILEARKTMGTAFGIKITHCRFSSEQSSRIADRIGFITDVEYTIEELNKIDPSLGYNNVKTKKIAYKTWVF